MDSGEAADPGAEAGDCSVTGESPCAYGQRAALRTVRPHGDMIVRRRLLRPRLGTSSGRLSPACFPGGANATPRRIRMRNRTKIMAAATAVAAALAAGS